MLAEEQSSLPHQTWTLPKAEPCPVSRGLSQAGAQYEVPHITCAAGRFGFVEMRTEELATAAMQLDKVELCGRPINVGRPKGYVEPMDGPAGGNVPGIGEARLIWAGGSVNGMVNPGLYAVLCFNSRASAAFPPSHWCCGSSICVGGLMYLIRLGWPFAAVRQASVQEPVRAAHAVRLVQSLVCSPL